MTHFLSLLVLQYTSSHFLTLSNIGIRYHKHKFKFDLADLSKLQIK